MREKKSEAGLRLEKDYEGSTSRARTSEEMQEARDQVTNVIVDASVDMTKRVVQSVNERGSVAGLQFLWKTAGMFPVPEGLDQTGNSSLAKTLIEQLGLYQDSPASKNDGKGDVELEES